MRPLILNYFFVTTEKIRGIGPKLRSVLPNLISTNNKEIVTKDIVFHLPYNVITRIKNPEINGAIKDKNIIISLCIEEVEILPNRGKNRYRIHCKNLASDKFFDLLYFNADERYIKSLFKKGKNIAVAGVAEKYLNRFQIIHPKYVLAAEEIEKIPVAEAVYPLTAGITSKILHKIINGCLENLPEIPEWIDKIFLTKNKWTGFLDSLKNIHNPKSYTDIFLDSTYRKRLAYDELLANQLAIGLTRKNIVKQKGFVQRSENILVRKFLQLVGFSLTNGQKDILKEVFSDMENEVRMFRLIQGDVGSGKTILAALAMIKSVEAGFQAAFMAPTEILAKQQYDWFIQVLGNNFPDEISVTLLTGSTKENVRKTIMPEIEEGKINIVIGTHALFQERIKFKNLGLIVIDEQHKFGVRQRMMLSDKGSKTDILLMSATPIPRTLTMTLYGDMDISLLKEKPAGRQKIDTRIISNSKLEEVTAGIIRAINSGEQVYWVCPLVSKSEEELFAPDETSIISAEERFEYLQKKLGSKVGLVHGKMKAEDKNKALLNFLEGNVKILVATTVIEVGVNVTNATIMIIENAEKFGLAQIHQLRGRVGRGSKKSNCILLYGENASKTSKERLKILRDTEDGFKIAEEDLALRGSGDLIGTKQSGLPEYNLAELPAHKELLFAARDDVKMIIEKDPELKSERGEALRNLLYLFEYDQHIKLLAA